MEANLHVLTFLTDQTIKACGNDSVTHACFPGELLSNNHFSDGGKWPLYRGGRKGR